MALYINNQEFSDKEVALKAQEWRQERLEWSEQQAREYLAANPRRKYYHCDIYYPEVDDTAYLPLPDDIIAHINDPHYDIAQALAALPLNGDYFRRLFLQETGKTPLQYLTSIRIRRARELIDVYGDTLSLFRIAEQCGYTDYVYFSRRFKETCGMSPRAYQARVRGG